MVPNHQPVPHSLAIWGFTPFPHTPFGDTPIVTLLGTWGSSGLGSPMVLGMADRKTGRRVPKRGGNVGKTNGNMVIDDG